MLVAQCISKRGRLLSLYLKTFDGVKEKGQRTPNIEVGIRENAEFLLSNSWYRDVSIKRLKRTPQMSIAPTGVLRIYISHLPT